MKSMTVLRSPARCLIFLGLGAVCASGCGGDAIVPVEGTVTLDGAPLADASVALNPLRATAPGPFFGTTDAKGRFALGTAEDVAGGAAVGEYRLIISTVKLPEGALETTPPPTQKEVVPPEYRNGVQMFRVPAGGTREANFELKSP